MGNPIFPTLPFFHFYQWKIFPIWFCWPPNKREFEFKSQPVSSTFPHIIDVPFNPRDSLFKIIEAIRVPFLHWWRRNLSYMLIAFQSQMLMSGNLDNTCGDDLLLEGFHLTNHLRKWQVSHMSGSQWYRRFRFNSNPKGGIVLISLYSLDRTPPLRMISDKWRKISYMNVSEMRNWIGVNSHETHSFM